MKYKIIKIVFTLSLLSCSSQEVNKITKSHFSNFTIPEIPKEMYFADMKIKLIDEDIKERLDRELLTNIFFQSATTQIIKRANRWFPLIEEILKEENIPTDFKYLAVIESALVQAVSPAGAQGFWQFMPTTALEYNLEKSAEVDERLDVIKSTKAACKYLHKSKKELNDWLLAAAAYNRGMNGIKEDMKWQKANTYFDMELNSETGRYVYRILAFKLIMENQKQYGFEINENQLYKAFKTDKIEINTTIPNLSEWALNKGINYKIIKKLNPWILSNKLTIKNKNYTILVPTSEENLKPYQAY
jgi:membrane-bound lytic murein transglycosylase D